jgi:hypothetical protein
LKEGEISDSSKSLYSISQAIAFVESQNVSLSSGRRFQKTDYLLLFVAFHVLIVNERDLNGVLGV